MVAAETPTSSHRWSRSWPTRSTSRARRRRDARFVDGVRTLRVGGAVIQLSERILLVLAGIVAPLGLVLVLLGYLGASQHARTCSSRCPT